MANSEPRLPTVADYERLLVLAEADGDEGLIERLRRWVAEQQARTHGNAHAAKLNGL